jgi:hypothetical protein
LGLSGRRAGWELLDRPSDQLAALIYMHPTKSHIYCWFYIIPTLFLYNLCSKVS